MRLDAFREVYEARVRDILARWTREMQIASARHDAWGRVALTLRDRPETLTVSRSYAHLFKQM